MLPTLIQEADPAPQHSQHQQKTVRQQPPAMSYSYGPTVIFPAFSMGEPFGISGYDAKENYGAFQGMHAVKVCVPLWCRSALRTRGIGSEMLTISLYLAGDLLCVRGEQ